VFEGLFQFGCDLAPSTSRPAARRSACGSAGSLAVAARLSSMSQIASQSSFRTARSSGEVAAVAGDLPQLVVFSDSIEFVV